MFFTVCVSAFNQYIPGARINLALIYNVQRELKRTSHMGGS